MPQVILSPVEAAIKNMRDKINRMKKVLTNTQDTKMLQLELQGGIATSVHEGPYAIADAFLRETPTSEQNDFHQQLRMCFQEFVKLYVEFAKIVKMQTHACTFTS